MKSRFFETLVFGSATILMFIHPASSAEGQKEQESVAQASSRAAKQLDEAFRACDEVVVFELDPHRADQFDHSEANLARLFGGYAIISQVKVTDPEEKKQLVDSLREAILKTDGSFDLCFRPRHGLRIRTGSTNFDVVICFECRQIDMRALEEYFPIAPIGQQLFDQVLRRIPASSSK